MAPGAFRPVSNGVSVLKQVFPNAQVTSGFRPVGTKLAGGQVNDKSWHTQSHAAVDIAPIPGMTFEQARARLEAAGYVVHPDSRDEVTNPSRFATGPHWHFVIGGR